MINLDLHSESCQENNCQCVEDTLAIMYKTHSNIIPFKYEFQFMYKKYTAIVNPCLCSFNGVQHSKILNVAIKRIKSNLGLEITPGAQIHSENSEYIQYPNTYRDYELTNGDVFEIVTEGGFRRKYFVIHKINDLNLNDIMNQPETSDWLMQQNIKHLQERVNQFKN